ncbi:MAG: tetratricopeptide repeat protein [Bacteroidetes bacterium]|nr:tetratricopeptide repeat protein [Bacteroidota bacterium]
MSEIDSLQNILANNKKIDTTRVNVLNKLASLYTKSSHSVSLKHAFEADSLSNILNYDFGKAESNRIIGVVYISKPDYTKAIFHLDYSMDLFYKIDRMYGVFNCLNSLGTAYSYIGDLEKALEYFYKSLEISDFFEDSTIKTLAYNNIGNIFYFQGDYDSALEHYHKALEIREKNGEASGMAGSYNNLGVIYKLKGDYPRALEYYQKSLKIREDLLDRRGVAMSYNNIGVIYDMQGDYESALSYYEKALEIRKELGDKAGISTGYNNIGHIYQNIGEYQNALKYYYESLSIKTEIGDKNDMALTFNNIANAYLSLKDYRKSHDYFIKAISLSKEVGIKSIEAWGNAGLGELFFNQNDYPNAYSRSRYAYKLANEIGEIKLRQKSAEILSHSAAKIGLYEEAYKFHIINKNLSDSIKSEENIRKTIGLEFEYRYEKEKEIARLEKEKSEALFEEELVYQKNIRNYLIVGFILLALLLSVLAYGFVQRRKKNRLLAIQRSLEFKQNFLANMSHEIRTPLTGLVGMIDILKKTELDEDQKDYISTLKQSSENLQEIINQILDYAKIESGVLKLNVRVFKFENIMLDAKKLFNSICNKDIEFIVEIDDDIPDYIVADRGRIMQIINNLVLNAVKFTDKGKISIIASLIGSNIASNEITLRIEVRDTGIGVKKEKRNTLFVPFGQIDQTDIRGHDGSGLGLSICKELAKMQGGEIGFESEVNVGSSFWFTIKAKVGHDKKENISE